VGAVTLEIVGRVRSIIIVFAEAIAEGPVVVAPVTEFALSWRIKFPSEQLVSVTEYVVPLPVTVGVLHEDVPPN
jgi:hypothetical protein